MNALSVLLALMFAAQNAPKVAPVPLPPHAVDSLVPVRPSAANKSADPNLPFAQHAPSLQSSTPAPIVTQEVPTNEAPVANVPIVRAYDGTFDQGFDELRAHADKREFDAALATADALLAPNSFLRWRDDWRAPGGWRKWTCDKIDPLLDTAGWNGLPAVVRAELWYAKGVVHDLAQQASSKAAPEANGPDTKASRSAAEDSFAQALALAGSLEVGRDALYDLGTLALRTGEEERAKLPEISGQPAQQAPPVPSAAGASDTKAPDPLDLARTAYMKARAHYVDRLKVGALDLDTQANTELVMKRLRELDEIQKKREEKKKQDQQKKDEQKKDDKKDSQDKPDKDKSDKDKQDSKDKPDSKDKSDKQEPPKDPQANEDPKKDEKKPEEPKPDEKQPDDKDKQQKQQPAPDPNDPKQQQMSKEQMTQILDRLQQLEEQSKKIQEQLRAARRAKVKKDW